LNYRCLFSRTRLATVLFPRSRGASLALASPRPRRFAVPARSHRRGASNSAYPRRSVGTRINTCCARQLALIHLFSRSRVGTLALASPRPHRFAVPARSHRRGASNSAYTRRSVGTRNNTCCARQLALIHLFPRSRVGTLALDAPRPRRSAVPARSHRRGASNSAYTRRSLGTRFKTCCTSKLTLIQRYWA
jgi:hypothetical protein